MGTLEKGMLILALAGLTYAIGYQQGVSQGLASYQDSVRLRIEALEREVPQNRANTESIVVMMESLSSLSRKQWRVDDFIDSTLSSSYRKTKSDK